MNFYSSIIDLRMFKVSFANCLVYSFLRKTIILIEKKKTCEKTLKEFLEKRI